MMDWYAETEAGKAEAAADMERFLGDLRQMKEDYLKRTTIRLDGAFTRMLEELEAEKQQARAAETAEAQAAAEAKAKRDEPWKEMLKDIPKR